MCVGFEPVTIVWIHLQRDVIRIPARQHKSGGGECNRGSFKDSFPQGTQGLGFGFGVGLRGWRPYLNPGGYKVAML